LRALIVITDERSGPSPIAEIVGGYLHWHCGRKKQWSL